MKNISKISCILFTTITGVSNAATTYEIDFANINNTLITQEFGDNAEANISYREIEPQFGNVASGIGLLNTWASGYGDLTGIAWTTTNGNRGEIRIDALSPNATIILNSFNLGAWATDQSGSWSIFNSEWNLLASGSNTVPTTAGRLSVFPNVTSQTGGLILQWGDDAWDIGIDNISYTISSVPIPAAFWLFGSGLLLLFKIGRS